MFSGGARKIIIPVSAVIGFLLLPVVSMASLEAGEATSTSVTLNWTAPGDDAGVGTASQYDIRYSSATITAANWASATQVSGEPAPAVTGTAQTMEVTDLQPSTSYYFAIKAADEVLG